MTAKKLIKETRTDRGLPERIEDPAVLARVAAIVASAGEKGGK